MNIAMIVVKEVPTPAGQPAKHERTVVGPYADEAAMRSDMSAAEAAGCQTAAYEMETPEVFRSTLGLPL